MIKYALFSLMVIYGCSRNELDGNTARNIDDANAQSTDEKMSEYENNSVFRKSLTDAGVLEIIEKTHRYNVIHLLPYGGDLGGYREPLRFGPKSFYLEADQQIGETRYEELVVLKEIIRSGKSRDYQCLCSPQFIIGLSLYGIDGKRVGYVFMAKNHNGFLVINESGGYKNYRFDDPESKNSGIDIGKLIDQYLESK